MGHFSDVGATYIKGGCILLHWPAYWSRTFLHCPYPIKSAFHPSGPSRMLPANPSFYFILLLSKNCTDTCQCIKQHCKTGCRKSAQHINYGSSFVCETAAWNKLLLFFCLAAPRSGLYLFFPWRPLFPEHLQWKSFSMIKLWHLLGYSSAIAIPCINTLAFVLYYVNPLKTCHNFLKP